MQKSLSPSLSFVVILLSLFVSSRGNAQLESGIGPSLTGSSPAAYYYISKPGEITMPVNLWGYVKNPGRYEVPISTDLVQLVSFAGGPLAEANIGSVKVTRAVRGESSVRKVEFTVNLNRLDQLDEKALGLEPGDTIFIERSSFSVGDIVGVITTAAIITVAVANVVTAVRQK